MGALGDNEKQIVVRVDKSLWKKLRTYCILHDTSNQFVVSRLIEAFVDGECEVRGLPLAE